LLAVQITDLPFGLQLLRTVVHYFLHLVFPVLMARWFFPQRWKTVSLLLLLTMLVDLDHLIATPVFDPARASIGFHPLHSWWACGLYLVGAIVLKGNLRIIALGLLLHMLTDFQDFFLWRMIAGFYQ